MLHFVVNDWGTAKAKVATRRCWYVRRLCRGKDVIMKLSEIFLGLGGGSKIRCGKCGSFKLFLIWLILWWVQTRSYAYEFVRVQDSKLVGCYERNSLRFDNTYWISFATRHWKHAMIIMMMVAITLTSSISRINHHTIKCVLNIRCYACRAQWSTAVWLEVR